MKPLVTVAAKGTILGLVMGLAPSLASAQTICVSQVDLAPDDPFHYAQAVVASFIYANAAVQSSDRAMEEYEKSEDVLEGLTALIFGAKAEQADLSCAVRMLDGYEKSTNQFIAAGAEVVRLAYVGLIAVDYQQIEFIKATIDNAGKSDLGGFVEKSADLRLKKNEAWKLLFASSAAATYGLCDFPDDPNEGLRSLALTKDQRRILIEKLEKEFGTSIRKGPQAGHSSVEGAAATLHVVLSDPNTKSRDTGGR